MLAQRNEGGGEEEAEVGGGWGGKIYFAGRLQYATAQSLSPSKARGRGGTGDGGDPRRSS